MNANGTNDLDLGDDLKITSTTRRAVGAGTWLARRARPTDALRMGEH